MKIGNDGYAFLLNSSGNFVAHQKMDVVINEIKFLNYYNNNSDKVLNEKLQDILKKIILIIHL